MRTTKNSVGGSQYNELSGSKDNPHLYIHNTSKPPMGGLKGIVELHNAKKDLTVGIPYKAKTKLPFYDNNGTFKSSKIGGSNKKEHGGSPQVTGTFKMRSISHHYTGMLNASKQDSLRGRSYNPSANAHVPTMMTMNH